MNFTILIFFMAIAFGMLWLATKFLGRSGLIVFVVTAYFFNLLFIGTSVNILGGVVPLSLTFYPAGIFAVYLIFKRYGVGEGLKAIAIVFALEIIYGLSFAIYYLYIGVSFFTALDLAFVPKLISMLGIAVSVGFAYWLFSVNNLFNKLNENFKAFLIIAIATFIDLFIGIMLGTIGVYTFGQMLLNVLASTVVAVIVLGIFFIFERFIKVEENPNIGERLHTSLKKTIAKTKKLIDKDEETTSTKKEEKKTEEKQTNEETEEAIVVKEEKPEDE